MESEEQQPEQEDELSIQLPDAEIVSFDFETDLMPSDIGTVYYETTYQQLVRDRDDLRQRYDRERRERESLEIKFHNELDQRVYFEERMSELSTNLSSYEEELQALRLENSRLRAQFGQLRSAVQTRLSSSAVGLATVDRGGLSLGNNSVFVTNEASSVGGNSDVCKQEIALLAQENELFKQIIDAIDKTEQSKVGVQERLSLQGIQKQRWLENEDVIRLERDKAQLEDRVRELERSVRDQEKLLDDVQSKADDNLRIYQRESKELENELYSQSTVLEDYEAQISQTKQSYEEEIRQMEVKLEIEFTNNKQFQEQTHQLERNIRKLEEERKELLLRIEEAYKAENEVMEERTVLEENYSRDVIELRRTLEEEIQKTTEMSMEIERLMSELIESDKQKKEMEARFFQEAQELKIQLDKQREGVYTYLNGAAANQVMLQANMMQETRPGTQFPSSGNQLQTNEEDWRMKFCEEVRKKERLEEENKKLLYRVNDLMEQNVSGGATHISTKDKLDCEVTKKSHPENSKKLKELVSEIDELRETCQVLEREAKKKKVLENKNIELSEEIEELTVNKDETIRKQKELMKELDNSLSSVQQVEDRNKKLAEEVETLSSKIRQMEDNFKNEREDWIRNYTKDKTLQINEVLSEKESIERKYNEQVNVNRSLEAEMSSLETRVNGLERTNGRLERKHNEKTEELNFERGRTKTMKDELDKSVELFKKQTEHLETRLYGKKRKYDEEIRNLDEEKLRIRAELENEKQTYKRRFEEERKLMEKRINEIEAKLWQQDAASGEHTGTSCMKKQLSPSLSTQTILGLKMQLDAIKNEKKELQETLRDAERKYRREIDDLEYNREQKIKMVKIEIEQEFRRKIYDYEKQIEELKKTDVKENTYSQGRGACLEGSTDNRSYNDTSEQMAKLVQDHNEQMDDLRRQIRLQMEAFENEKQNLKRELQEERQIAMGDKKGEGSLLSTVNKLTEKVNELKQERDVFLNKLKKERTKSNRRITEMSTTVAKVKDECGRVRKEKEEAQKSVNDLRRKIVATESRIRGMEEKHRRELHQMEVKYEFKKTTLEQDTTIIETQLKESLQIEYQAALNKEREKYEDTMHVLKKEITSLQEQRKQIQMKLTSQSTQSSYSLLVDKTNSTKKQFCYTTDPDVELSFSRGLKQMEDRINDLDLEVERLKKEKVEMKASYRQEKVQIQAEFDRERDRLEKKYRRQIEDLKSRLQTATAQVQSTSILASKKWDRTSRTTARYSSDATELLLEKNLFTDSNLGPLESEMNILKDRMDHIEERQKRSMESKPRKSTNVRLQSNMYRGRLSSRLSSSMMDLNSSTQLRGGVFEKSRNTMTSQKTGLERASREAGNTASFLSQSQNDLRSPARGAWPRDDQSLQSRGYGARTLQSMSLSRQEIIPSHSTSFFGGRTLSGFDTSRSSGFLQTGNSFRDEQFFLPSVGILGGLSQAKGGASGGSLIGNYRSVRGPRSGVGFPRVMPETSFYGQGGASGFDGRLLHSASLTDIHQQVQGSSSNAASQQSSIGAAGPSQWNNHSVAASTEPSQQTVGREKQTEAIGAVSSVEPVVETRDFSVGSIEISAADRSVTSNQDNDQAAEKSNAAADGQDEETPAEQLSEWLSPEATNGCAA